MRRIRIYYPGDLDSGQTLGLDAATSNHLVRVLRRRAGDTFWIFNGRCGEFEATVIEADKKAACIEIGKFHEPTVESPLSVHLGQVISRGERMDYAIQKAVELGVMEITPIFSEYCQIKLSSERAVKRVAHWQAVAVSAAEQSGRCIVPVIHLPISLDQWVETVDGLKIVCCPNQEAEKLSALSDTSPEKISIAIGSEGGFSSQEIEHALKNNCMCLSLGPRVLRTETATAAALTLLQYRWGDMKAATT